MRIDLQPTEGTPKSLTGDLLVNGEKFCFFLTLPLGNGLPGSAIPVGIYSVTISPSPKFLRVSGDDWVARYANAIPHINGIPARSNILIHWGNDAHDTDGCILVGETLGTDFIGQSRKAFERLQPLIVAATANPLEGCELQM